MKALLDEIEIAANAGLYFVAMQAAISIPDLCGALGAANGRATPARYRDWWDNQMPTAYVDHIDGARAYGYRNSLLHQGRAEHEKRPNDRIILMEPRPDGSLVHRGTHVLDDEGSRALVLYAPFLIADLIEAARTWLSAKATDPVVTRNYLLSVARYAEGWPGVIQGTAVIT